IDDVEYLTAVESEPQLPAQAVAGVAEAASGQHLRVVDRGKPQKAHPPTHLEQRRFGPVIFTLLRSPWPSPCCGELMGDPRALHAFEARPGESLQREVLQLHLAQRFAPEGLRLNPGHRAHACPDRAGRGLLRPATHGYLTAALRSKRNR